jgi:hypothetical protein
MTDHHTTNRPDPANRPEPTLQRGTDGRLRTPQPETTPTPPPEPDPAVIRASSLEAATQWDERNWKPGRHA